jgi:hypothetical protein
MGLYSELEKSCAGATLAVIVLAFFGGMMGAAALVPEILDKNPGGLTPEGQNLALAAAKDAPSPQETSSSSDFSPRSRSLAKGTPASAHQWAERMFTAGRSKDFGAVPFGTQLLHRFAMTNIYAAPVEITGFRLGCCCVAATPGKRILQPGESTTIDVALDTRQFTGPNTQTVRVGIGPNPRSACVLKVSAVSQTDLVFKPERVNFGTVRHGQASVQSVDVEYHGALDWKIKEVIVDKELPLEATLSEPVRQPGKVGYRLDVALKANVRPGRIRDYIYLKTNQADFPPVPVLVTATVEASQGLAAGVPRPR